jgi:predicted Zn-dependent protease with MMP-like domain/predicted nucleic acid-binding protein
MNDGPKHEVKEEDEPSDPGIEAGWHALEDGDIAAARAAAQVGLTKESTRMDAMLLEAAAAREDGDLEAALESLQRAATADPDWCTPEMWMAELLAEDTNRLGEALRHARRALDRADDEDEYLSALGCKAAIELDLERPTEALRTLKGLPAADVALDDPMVGLEFAELLVDAGDPTEARARLQTLTTQAPELADAWYLLGGCCEMLDDDAGKRTAWMKTRTLDREAMDVVAADGSDVADLHAGHDHPTVELSEEALIAIAEETLAEIPEDLRKQMQNVPVIVSDLPALTDVETGLDPRMLGMFSGASQAENSGVLNPPTLTEIVLFRRNIERVAHDEESLRDEVRTTLLHEAGHFFGLDEAALTRLGLQ